MLFNYHLLAALFVLACQYSIGTSKIVTIEGPTNPYCPDDSQLKPYCTCQSSAYQEIVVDCSAVKNENQLNQIFTTATFAYQAVQKLIIRNNQALKYISKNVFGPVTFQNITFENSAIKYIDESAFANSLQTLMRWEMRYCNLVPQGFPFSSIQTYNNLRSIYLDTAGTFDILPRISSSSLQNYHVVNSGIWLLQNGAFGAVPNLIDLDLSYNNLSSLTKGIFQSFAFLTEVDLSHNEISYIEPGSFFDLPKLERLILSFNELPFFLLDNFGQFPSLTSLKINDNQIHYVERDLLTGCPLMHYVYANNNNLTSLEAGSFSNLKNGLLWLRSNSITTLKENWLRTALESKNNVDVADNPLDCGCEMAWLFGKHSPMTARNLVGFCQNGTDIHDLDPSFFANSCPSQN